MSSTTGGRCVWERNESELSAVAEGQVFGTPNCGYFGLDTGGRMTYSQTSGVFVMLNCRRLGLRGKKL